MELLDSLIFVGIPLLLVVVVDVARSSSRNFFTSLNKLATCVCLNCDVNYTPTQYQTLRPIAGRPGAPMAEIELKLDFMETELITKEKVLEGF